MIQLERSKCFILCVCNILDRFLIFYILSDYLISQYFAIRFLDITTDI